MDAATTQQTRRSWSRGLAFALAIAAVMSCIATVVYLVAQPDGEAAVDTVLWLIYLNSALLLLLGLVVARRLVTLFIERRRGQAGSGLHVRLVLLFGLIASAPAILMAVFSMLFVNYGLQIWFSERIDTALDRSLRVASAYLKEHREAFSNDILQVANDLNVNAEALRRFSWQIDPRLTDHMTRRNLTELLLVDSTGRVVNKSELSLAGSVVGIPANVFQQATLGEITLIETTQQDRVRAVYKLDAWINTYMVIERFVEPTVLSHIESIESATREYQALEEERGGVQISFALIFLVTALLLLLAAVWTGLTVATQMAHPISRLISAAERIREGDLETYVEPPESDDEISNLSRAFNRMTTQIRAQQEGLVDANRQLDERRRFTETVLAGVSAGVIGLDEEGRINLPNRSASELLATDLGKSIGERLDQVVPEMADLIDGALRRPSRLHRSEIRLVRGGSHHTLLVRVAVERLNGRVVGFVVTFDDITDLQSAQRKAAWADVARRIAHEIKNPLTPIQLSAERLSQKYAGQIEGERERFERYTSTIVRQVEEIGRMVDEFSSFARMPEPVITREDLSALVRDAVFLERERTEQVTFNLDAPDEPCWISCDGRQISRVLTNLLKNAVEAVEARMETSSEPPGLIAVHMDHRSLDAKALEAKDGERITVTIEDNGVGLPEGDRARLTEPYVTTREKGTGLGLAIVKKIMEDHGGDLILGDNPNGGARIELVFNEVEEGYEEKPAGMAVNQNPMAVATALYPGRH